MTKKLVVGQEIYEYPDTGDSNYGEAATGWAEAVTEVAAEVRGPGDIPTTKTTLIGALSAGFYTGDVTNMKFDTAYVQRIVITGFITRTYSGAAPLPADQVEAFSIEGVYNGSLFTITQAFSGDDTEVEFDTNGGQFTFKYKDIANTDTVIVKFSAKSIVDEAYFA